MVNTWIDAIREYSKDGKKYAVPKKNTPEHDAVTEIQKRLKGLKLEIPPVVTKEEIALAVVPKTPKKPKKVKAVVEEVIGEGIKTVEYFFISLV
jgi:transposase